MSGASMSPASLTGGAGYKANPVYDEFLNKHSAFYRRHSAAGREMAEDRRRSSAAMDASAAQQAVANIEAQRDSVTNASGGAAVHAIGSRKGSVVVASDSDRRDSIHGLEATAGNVQNQGRRPSTSLASDLYHKLKGDA